jgi:hypothetical protein
VEFFLVFVASTWAIATEELVIRYRRIDLIAGAWGHGERDRCDFLALVVVTIEETLDVRSPYLRAGVL